MSSRSHLLTWYSVLPSEISHVGTSTDRRMLRYVAGVRWQGRVSSEEVLRKCDLEDIGSKLRNRLRRFGPVKRSGENSTMGRVMTMEVPGRRLVARTEKRWRRCIYEHMEDRGIEGTAENRDKWKKVIARPNEDGDFFSWGTDTE